MQLPENLHMLKQLGNVEEFQMYDLNQLEDLQQAQDKNQNAITAKK